ncbi:hypothetical protein KM043_002658 [Ampulex compressa]|nr:hypothetical protein KM043_002658 [Ampulex compressa]
MYGDSATCATAFFSMVRGEHDGRTEETLRFPQCKSIAWNLGLRFSGSSFRSLIEAAPFPSSAAHLRVARSDFAPCLGTTTRKQTEATRSDIGLSSSSTPTFLLAPGLRTCRARFIASRTP